MIAGIVGDVLCSVYEGYQWSDKNQPLITNTLVSLNKSIKPLFKEMKWVRHTQSWTDDTLCTLALYKAYINSSDPIPTMVDICTRNADPATGFGKAFGAWLKNPVPYESWANGSIMRLGFIPYLDITLEQKLSLAHDYTAISHNHEVSLTAVTKYIEISECLKQSKTKDSLIEYIKNNNITDTVETMHTAMKFEMGALRTLEQALVIIAESTSMEEVFINCCYVGGDSDTLACIAGNLANFIYPLPEHLKVFALKSLESTPELKQLVDHFEYNYYCDLYSSVSDGKIEFI